MADVTIYTRQLCGFCSAATALLRGKNVDFQEIDATFDPVKRAEMIDRSGGKSTFPQIFIGNQHIGGCDDLMLLECNGKLEEKLASQS